MFLPESNNTPFIKHHQIFSLYILGTLVPNMFPMGSHVFPNYVMGFNIHLLPIVAGDRLVTGQVARQKRGSLC